MDEQSTERISEQVDAIGDYYVAVIGGVKPTTYMISEAGDQPALATIEEGKVKFNDYSPEDTDLIRAQLNLAKLCRNREIPIEAPDRRGIVKELRAEQGRLERKAEELESLMKSFSQ